MKKAIHIICTLILLFGTVMQVTARDNDINQVGINYGQLQQKGDSLYIRLQLNLSQLEVGSNRYMILTPLLIGEVVGNEIELPAILINGANRSKAYLRSMSLKKDQPEMSHFYKILRSGKDSRLVDYTMVIPYVPWMATARLDIENFLCGCAGNEERVLVQALVDKVDVEKIFTPLLAYIEPIIETVKMRNERREISLDFPVNQSSVRPDYMNNQSELSKVETMLAKIQGDKNFTITSISITGFASPEGSVAGNEILSIKRAQALKGYLLPLFPIASHLYHIEYGGENWVGLLAMVEASSIHGKEKILSILKETPDVMRRKTELKKLDGGKPYKEMLTTMYPKLRKAVCEVNFSVRSFSVDEAKIVLENEPQLLSLNEVYQIARTYPQGTESFYAMMQIGAKVFANDPVANLNAAAAALSCNDIPGARKYMSLANKDMPEYANNMGVLLFLQGEVDQAIIEFEKAARVGVAVAKDNLQQLRK